MAKSAMSPSGTGFFTPLRLSPEAVSLIAAGDGLPLPSNSASVPIASPRRSRQPLLLLRVAAGEQDRFRREIDRGRERHRRAPPHRREARGRVEVSRHVGGDLCGPVVEVVLEVLATVIFTAMPEAAIDEDRYALFCEDDVRSPA